VNKREHILTVAEALFAEHGYEGTSVRALAKRAGVNVAMISYYFGSKEKLFEALVEYRASYLRNKLKDVKKDFADPVRRIGAALDLVVDRIFSNPGFHKLIHREMSLEQRSEMSHNIVNVLMLNIGEIRKIIHEGIKQGVFRKADTDMLLLTVFSATSQVAQSSLFSARILGRRESKNLAGIASVRKRTKTFLRELLMHYLLTPVK
jgi:AcrR family transcriptional regulator